MRITTLEEVCTHITDGAHNSPQSVHLGFPMASVKDLTPFGINLDGCRHISEYDYNKLVKQGCQPEIDDILISKDGASAIDTVCIIKKKENVVMLSSVAILRPNKKVIHPRYLKLYLDCKEIKKYIKNSFVTGAAIPRVVLKDFKQCQIRLPLMTSQEKIVSILFTYDDLIENNNRRIIILEEMVQRLYREWFIHFRFPGYEKVKMIESEMGLIPEGWTVSNFYDEAKILSGGTPSKTNSAYWDNGIIPLFSPKDANNQIYVQDTSMYITELGLQKCNSGLYPPNTVIITARGTVGKIVLSATDMAINQSCYALVGKRFGQIFLFHHLKNAVNQLKKIASGTAFDAIITDSFKTIQCIIPEESVYTEFENRSSVLFQEILLLQKKNANLLKTRDLLLPQLISGDIDVSKLDI